jgi:hypothetical protein
MALLCSPCLLSLAPFLYAVLHQVLGFPVQLVGLLTLPYLAVRWYVDGNDASKDIEAAAVSNAHCVTL